ncbi:hypothetical protein CC80DRAFT_491243 [Byssothecium circinans]|uniref:Altered inheritance of mitochondria protein 6 n=1 Tax=Byssothecium circinans TaxID=147558 RepID=A0A6A5U4K1_9PLEO|nr:hypothetical protein CC80DRAFT_491243 [Byssothecium circinans]
MDPVDDNTLNPLLGNFDSNLTTSPSSKDQTVVSLRALEDGEDDSEIVELRARHSVLGRLLMAVRRRRNGTSQEEEELTERKPKIQVKGSWRDWRRRRFWVRVFWGIPLGVVLFFGIVHIVNVFFSSVNVLQDDEDPFPSSWGPLTQFREGKEIELEGLTRDVTPIHCHSHNDYWRKVPLYEALRWGCTGVEADVWLFDDELFVGHNTNELTRERTFRSMYVDPLMRILDLQNTVNKNFTTSGDATKYGVYEVDPMQTLVLLVDFKNNGHDIYPFVSEQLARFRSKGYLSYFDGNTTVPGPITIVATGNAPFDLITANTTYRDIFFDAPLDRMHEEPSLSPTIVDINAELHRLAPPTIKREDGQGSVGTDENSHFDLTNSYYASVNFGASIGWLWFGRISDAQLKLIRGQIQGAKKRGLKARYWSTPKWPIGLRNKVWKVLVEEGVDYLNGDDLKAMTTMNWGVKRHWGWLG